MNEMLEQKFNDIYNQTYNHTLKYVVSKCDNLGNVEDIMQNVYTKLYKTISKDKSYVDNYESFLIKLSKNELFKYYSLKNKFKIIFDRDMEENEVDLINNIKDEKIDIDDEIDKKISLEDIWEKIQQQDLTTQKILTLYYLEEIKISEIAKILELNESTVKTKLYRSIKQIKEELEKECE